MSRLAFLLAISGKEMAGLLGVKKGLVYGFYRQKQHFQCIATLGNPRVRFFPLFKRLWSSDLGFKVWGR